MTDLLTAALAAVRDAERRLVAGEISRPQFDAIAGSNVAVIAEAAEREAEYIRALRSVHLWMLYHDHEDTPQFARVHDLLDEADKRIAASKSKGGE